MKRIKAAIIGMGYIGVSHIEAIRRIGFAGLIAVADANIPLARRNLMRLCYESVDCTG